MNKSKTVYEAFYGDYIGKRVMVSEDGHYHCGDYISERFYSGILTGVSYSERGLVLHLDNELITVFSITQISIIK